MAGTVDYGLGPYTYPRGWFMVADAAKVGRVPLNLRYFGQDVVIYRGESGRVVMLDAYCPHMNTHMGKNTTSYTLKDGSPVEGDSIRCPYHAWRFGADGKCDHIPYFKGPVPAAAKVRSWTVQERYGAIWTWHDPEGLEADFDLPAIDEWDQPDWVRWNIDDLGQLSTHSVEIIDNMADVAHLGPTHGAPCEYFRNEITDHVCRQLQGGRHATLAGGGLLETNTYYTGPGILLSRFEGQGSIMFITHTPIEDGRVQAWHALLVQAPNCPPSEQDVANARMGQEYSRLAFAQDFEIWGNKQPCLQVLQLPTDGPYSKIRGWYSQFYNPRSVAAEIQKKFNGTYTVRDMPTEKAAA